MYYMGTPGLWRRLLLQHLWIIMVTRCDMHWWGLDTSIHMLSRRKLCGIWLMREWVLWLYDRDACESTTLDFLFSLLCNQIHLSFEFCKSFVIFHNFSLEIWRYTLYA